MEDKTVIIMETFAKQEGRPFEWAVMIDGKAVKISSWDKQEIETGKRYKVTLLDEDAKDVQYSQRRMKKDGKVELLGTDEAKGTEPQAEIIEETKETNDKRSVTESKIGDRDTTDQVLVPPKHRERSQLVEDDYDDEFYSSMIEEDEKDKANDKPLEKHGTNRSGLGTPSTDDLGSALATTNYQRSQLVPNSNKLQLNLESIMILNPIATKQNAMKFLQKCIWQNLNPFIGDCYLITYKNNQTGEQDMSMVVSKDVFLKRSAKNPDYEGFEAGIIVKVDKKLEHREGSVYIAGDEILIGGWAKVYIKGLKPVYAQVLVAEYHTGKSLWKTKPATMIRKVALSQAMREAHPVELQGLYDETEMNVEKIENE